MKVLYSSHPYVSYRRTAEAYRKIIRSKHDTTEYVSEADVVIVHGPPSRLEQLYVRYPLLRRKYVIGYCVWEASDLPEVYKNAVSSVNEIWTCSEYCRRIFENYHGRVTQIPHVIERDTTYNDVDVALANRAVGFDPGLLYFLSITTTRDKRKNVEALVRAFQNLKSAMPAARLILKLLPSDPLPVVSDERVLLLPLMLSDSAINALYNLSTAYVSPHHSEGWGLTLSDAMVLLKPVIATGYSGNLEFMTIHNSFPVNFTESTIRTEDCALLFDTRMKWAYPDQEDLEQKMLLLYENSTSAVVTHKVQRAAQDIARFDLYAVGKALLRRLDDISASRL